MNSIKNQNEITVGVDTGKHQLDIYVRPIGLEFSVSNDEKGIKEALSTLKKHQPTRIVIEATGRLEHAFILACAQANLPYVVANPMQVKLLVKEQKPTVFCPFKRLVSCLCTTPVLTFVRTQ